jgi:hypothetical protein
MISALRIDPTSLRSAKESNKAFTRTTKALELPVVNRIRGVHVTGGNTHINEHVFIAKYANAVCCCCCCCR